MKKVKVLHAVGTMDRGGVETWLVHVLRTIDQSWIEMDFLVHGPSPGALAAEAQGLGAKIIPIRGHRGPGYGRRLGRLLERERYDVLHSHLHFFNGRILRAAARAGVSIRIAHSHTPSPSLESATGPRALYVRLMHGWIEAYATHRIACSLPARSGQFGSGPSLGPEPSILRCGIDLSPFRRSDAADPGALREELGIPREATVIGHVGRFRPAKNHGFILEMAREAASAELDCVFLLVGDGDGEERIKEQARRLGLGRTIVFAGARSDVPRLLQDVVDVLVLPSLHEGLPLVLIEAQAAGVRSVVTHTVSEEVDVIEGAIVRLSLAESAAHWTRTALTTAAEPPLESPAEQVLRSPFNIDRSTDALSMLYGRATGRFRPSARA